MEDLRQRILEDLTDLIEGEIRTDPVSTSLYATDASLYEIEPAAVVFPKSASDVAALATWASDNDVPLIPRGAGTGLAGGALGSGVIVEFARHMNQVLDVRGDLVRVQPGVVHARLNRHLRNHGRCFAPAPLRSAVTTVGGMLAVDSAGPQAVRVGSTRDHVQELECVLMGGQRLVFTRNEPLPRRFAIREPVSPQTPFSTPADSRQPFLPPVRNETLPLSALLPASRRTDILERLSAVLDDFDEDISRHQPFMLRNACGYMLRGIRNSQSLDVVRLLAGSEGTLGLFTEATLYTLPLPEFRSLSSIMFGTTDDALQAMQLLLELEPSACDLLDRRLLSLGRDSDSRWESVVRLDAEAGLFLEFTGLSDREVQQRQTESAARLQHAGISHVITETTLNPDGVDALWRLPLMATTLLARLTGTSQPLPIIDDIAVPPKEISRFLTLAQKTFQRHEVTATLSAHAASGQLFLRPMLSAPTPQSAAALEALARDLYRHANSVGGTISGQGGDGLARTAFIRSQYGKLYRAFQQVKHIFDPQRLLNPDKIISDNGQLTVRNLRRQQTQPPKNTPVESDERLSLLQLTWSPEEAMQAAARCNGCGTCRDTDAALRMCPFFHETPTEEASPRSKANLLRRALANGTTEELLSHDGVRELAASCFNCRQCRLECPSEVDIPHLMLEARAQHVSSNGLSRTDWLLSRFHTYARFGSRFTRLVNRLLRHGVFRKTLERTVGIAAARRMPKFAAQRFLNSPVVRKECADAKPGHAQPTVVYFVDYFANHHDPQLALAFVRILQHQGFRVYVPPGQTVSGMAMLAVGDIKAAREVAEVNLRELGEPAREGFPIVCTEPSAALCLSEEYPMLMKHADVEVVAKQTSDAGTFLLSLHQQGRLTTDFQELPLKLVYHTPCHVKALGPVRGLYELLKLIPGIRVEEVNRGCTGMAGTFGLAAEHFDQSLQIGNDLITTLQTMDVTAGTTDCSSCRMQMEQSVSFPTLHPIKILALAWGLMPELAGQLKSRPSGYLMS